MKACKKMGDLKCDNHASSKNHMMCACIMYRKANNLTVHPWLLRFEGSANRVHADNEDEIFGSHPDNSLEVISKSDQSINLPNKAQQGGFSACIITLVSGVLSSDNEEYFSDTDLSQQHLRELTVYRSRPYKKTPTKTLGPIWLRRNRHERAHTRVRAPTEKVYGRVNFSNKHHSPAHLGVTQV